MTYHFSWEHIVSAADDFLQQVSYTLYLSCCYWSPFPLNLRSITGLITQLGRIALLVNLIAAGIARGTDSNSQNEDFRP